MAREMKIQQFLNLLETGDFEKLIGVTESEVIEFKGAPYQLDTTKSKLELAKDVSALANVRGGIIVMGIKTSIQVDHPREVAAEIRSFPDAMIDVKKYENIIAEWIYPKLNPEITWIPSVIDRSKGLAYILVPESETSRKPFLTVTILQQENDRVLGNVVGFFQRSGDKVVHWSVEELHHAFKDGLRFDEHLSGLNETFGKLLSQTKTPVARGISLGIVNQRIDNAIEAVGLKNGISYVLAYYPDTDMEIPGLFESKTSDVVKQIDYPPKLRYAGFDISTEERSRIVNGELRRSILKQYKLLEVWRDGMVVFVADGEGYLCRGNHEGEEFFWINALTLIETVYLFSLFVKEVFEAVRAPDCNAQVEIRVKNIPKNKKYGLSKAEQGLPRWQYDLGRDIAWAPWPNLVVNKVWKWKEVTPEKIAYQLVSELYAKFGVEHDVIPYVKECEGEKVIDIEQIKSIR